MLTLKDIYNTAQKLLKAGEKLEDYPIYLGDDDELNGIHNGWYLNLLSVNNPDEDVQSLIEMINEDNHTTGFTNKGILIS